MSPEVKAAYEVMVSAIRARAPHAEQVKHAQAYIDTIKARAKATGRALPVPKVSFLLRFHDA